MIDKTNISLVIPDISHEKEYCRIIELWESYNEKIQPPSIRRYSKDKKFTFSKWLIDIEDDRNTGSMLDGNIPCALYFFMDSSNEIYGGVSINHTNTFRGHLHLGIVPWHRRKGYGTIMFDLAINNCKEIGLEKIQVAPRKDNQGIIKIINRNGGIFIDNFIDNDIDCIRYEIKK